LTIQLYNIDIRCGLDAVHVSILTLLGNFWVGSFIFVLSMIGASMWALVISLCGLVEFLYSSFVWSTAGWVVLETWRGQSYTWGVWIVIAQNYSKWS